MKYTSNITTIIDLRNYALKHNGDENENESKWDKAESLVKYTMEGIDNIYYPTEEEKNLVKQRYITILNRLSDLIGYRVVEIEIDGYKCITKRTNNEDETEISEKVYPFDEKRGYPMQEIEMQYTFKQYR